MSKLVRRRSSIRIALERNGFVVIDRLFSTTQLAALHAHCRRAAFIARSDYRTEHCGVRSDQEGHWELRPGLDLVSSYLHRFARSKLFSGLAHELLRMEVLCVHVRQFRRAVWTGPRTRWRQECGTNSAHFRERAISFFLATKPGRGGEMAINSIDVRSDPNCCLKSIDRGVPVGQPDNSCLVAQTGWMRRQPIRLAAGSVLVQTDSVVWSPAKRHAHPYVLQVNYRQSPYRQALRKQLYAACHG